MRRRSNRGRSDTKPKAQSVTQARVYDFKYVLKLRDRSMGQGEISSKSPLRSFTSQMFSETLAMVSKPVRARRMCDRRKSARVKDGRKTCDRKKKCVKETKRNRTNKLGHKITRLRHNKGKNRGKTTLSTPLVPVYPKGHSRRGDPKAN